jgi:antitoxin CptB
LRELDVLLEPWFERHGAALSDTAMADFERFLDSNDMDIQDWLTGRSQPADPAFGDLIASLRSPD